MSDEDQTNDVFRRETAYHEAGHAVTTRVLTLAAGRATIKPSVRYEGYSIILSRHDCLIEWFERGKVRHSKNAVWHARIMATMAGAEAEEELLGSTWTGDAKDRREIERMAENLIGGNWAKQEPRLRKMTRMLVRRHRARIERVANALLEKTSLSAKQLDKLVGRSVDDVKVNAPVLIWGDDEEEKAHAKRRKRRGREPF